MVNWDEGIFPAVVSHNRTVRSYASDVQALLPRCFDAALDLSLGCGCALSHGARPAMLCKDFPSAGTSGARSNSDFMVCDQTFLVLSVAVAYVCLLRVACGGKQVLFDAGNEII
jgi:hypothetical protein